MKRRTFLTGLANAIGAPAIAHAWQIQKTNAAGYATAGVHFDGTAYMSLASLNATNTPFLLASCWLNSSSDIGMTGNPIWYCNATGPVGSNVTWSQGVFTSIEGNAEASSIKFGSSASITLNTWQNILIAADVNHASGVRIVAAYLDDVDVTTIFSDVGAAIAAIDLNGMDFTIGSDTFGDNMDANIADLYVNMTAIYYDLSITANRRKFISASLKPVDLGADGSTPTGTPPTLFLRRAPSAAVTTFANDLSGNGNNFTITGTLLPSATDPPS